jgi:hypothetical protein
MKILSTLILVVVISFSFHQKAVAQHPTPVDMLYQPLDDFFRFSGGGGGNLYGLFKASGAASGILSLDGNWNISEKIADAKHKINTVMVDFKIHPFINTLLRSGDSMDVRRFAFQDNDFRIQFGGRFTHLKAREKNPNTGSKTFAQGFLDIIIVPYQIENSVNPTDNKGFTSLSLNMGGKFGVMGKFMGGTFGITANPQLDLLFIMNGPNSTALEEATNGNLSALQLATIPKSARGYVAGGLKIEIPLNDFILSFDIRRYFKMGSGAELEGLTNNTLFSIGGIAMGSIFKNRSKKNPKDPKKRR